MNRLRAGQEDAATEVFRPYAHRLIGLVEITLRKGGRWRERFGTHKRDLRREQQRTPTLDESGAVLPIVANGPNPSKKMSRVGSLPTAFLPASDPPVGKAV